MKALILGDQFMTNEVLTECFERAVKDYPEKIELIYHSDNWPVEPVEKNEEVCEYCGDDAEIITLIKDVDILLTHTGCITSRVINAAEKIEGGRGRKGRSGEHQCEGLYRAGDTGYVRAGQKLRSRCRVLLLE